MMSKSAQGSDGDELRSWLGTFGNAGCNTGCQVPTHAKNGAKSREI